ncbi:MAG: GTP 3',8-cyclase MoaA [Limisphaerales bacterium]
MLIDSFGRVLGDLRVSVTDRCNFRCLYCLPETEEAANFYRSKFDAVRNPNPAPGPEVKLLRAWKPRRELLSFEEIERVTRLFVGLGIRKIRLTGGEPLLREDLPRLVARLASIPGIDDLALTTNGFLFARHARELRDAGLRRVSFSLDSLDPVNFRRMTGRDGLGEVLAAIALARNLGFHPVKVNAVVIRDLNHHEIEALAGFAQREDLSFRFIEFMPLDSGRAWLRDLVVPGREILATLQARFNLVPVPPAHPSETARRWRFGPTGSTSPTPSEPGNITGSAAGDAPSPSNAEIGIIAPVTEPFCGHCNRIRLTADGQIRTCLFSLGEHDLKGRLRRGMTDLELIDWLREVALAKEARHHIGEEGFEQPERTMSCIGG